MVRAGIALWAAQGEGATAAAAEDQTGQKCARPTRAVELVLFVVLAHALGHIDELLGDLALTRAHGLPEFVVDVPQFGDVLDVPRCFRVQTCDALSGRWIFDLAQPLPDQPADIEFIIHQPRATLHMAPNGCVAPWLAAGAGHAFLIQCPGNGARRNPRSKLAKHAPHEDRFSLVDLPVSDRHGHQAV